MLGAKRSPVLSQPEMRGQFEKMRAEVIASTPDQFTEQIASDTKNWAKIVKEQNIKADYVV